MDVIEKAIRSAFEKGNADDRAFREKVYRSAFAALDRALTANPNIAPEMIENRRADLQAKIVEIETEFIPAVSAEPEAELTVAPATPDIAPAALDVAPAVELGDRTEARAVPPVSPVVASPAASVEPAAPVGTAVEPRFAELDPMPADPGRPRPETFFPDASDFGAVGAPVPERPDGADEVTAVGGPNVASDRRRPLAGIFLGITLIALVAIGGWWGLSTGLIKLPGPPDTDVITKEPPADEDFTPGEETKPGDVGEPAKPGEADAARNWIFLFSPSDPTSVNAPGDTKAEVMTDDAGSFMRIRSGSSGSAIVFDIAQGALEEVAGKHAVFDIVARAEEGKETQFSVDCNFGELGDCGRKRYQAGYEKSDFLFDMELPAKSPGSAGTIAINTDIENGGKAIDVFEIKVSVSQ